VIASTFAIVFGIFVAALVVLCGFIVTWALRRDRVNWREWRERQHD
jgi:ABC-type Fe3+ transport system permease subunit